MAENGFKNLNLNSLSKTLLIFIIISGSQMQAEGDETVDYPEKAIGHTALSLGKAPCLAMKGMIRDLISAK